MENKNQKSFNLNPDILNSRAIEFKKEALPSTLNVACWSTKNIEKSF